MRRALLVLVCCLLALPAYADWQYTKWGMTPAQVLTASKGAFHPCAVQECRGKDTDRTAAKLIGTYAAGPFRFRSVANFDKQTGKLAIIKLELLAPERAAELVGAVRSKYGEPATTSHSSIMNLWVWRDQKDQISIIEIGRGASALVSLDYQPRVSETNKGL